MLLTARSRTDEAVLRFNKFNNTSFIGMLDPDALDLTGWEMIYTGGKLFAINNTVEKGIKVLKTNNLQTLVTLVDYVTFKIWEFPL